MRQPRPPGKITARQARVRLYEKEWEKNRSGVVVLRKGRNLRGSDLVAALERARDVTGDPVFAAALEAVRYYALDREFERNARRAQKEMFGDNIAGLLNQVAYLHRVGRLEDGARRKLSVREACAAVVADAGLGPSFGTAVENLRKQYLASPPSSVTAPPDLEQVLTALHARRIFEKEILVKTPRARKTTNQK